MTCLADLPIEVISHIMRFVSVQDRQEMALVCRRFYEASLDPVLQRDVVVSLQSFMDNYHSLRRLRPANMVLDGVGDSVTWIEACKQFSGCLLSLSVRGCDVTESTFITFLSHCRSLTSLDLTGCNSPFMTGKLLEKESDRALLSQSLSNVKVLKLASLRYLSNITFNRLIYLFDNLESLDMSSCQILYHSSKNTSYSDGSLLTFDNILDYFRKRPSVTGLSLSKTSLTNEALSRLARVKGLKLKSVDLSYCRDLGNQGMKELCEHQSKIQHLNLTGCPEIGDIVVEYIVMKLPLVKNLTLKQCAFVTDRSVVQLNSLKWLEKLNLSGVHRPSFVGLTKGFSTNLSMLTSLCLSGNSAVNDEVILSFCQNLSNLVALDLSSCFYITDRGLVSIFYHLIKLQELNLSHCKKLTDLGLLGIRTDTCDHQFMEGACKCVRKQNPREVFHLGIKLDDVPRLTYSQIEALKKTKDSESGDLKNLKCLRSLNFQGVANISDVSLTQVLEFSSLESLNLNMCSLVSDASLIAMAQRNPSLDELQIGSSGITDVGMIYLVEKLPRLRSLVISNCDQITDYTITAIGNNCRRLKYLDVSFCGRVSEAAMEYLDLRLPYLHDVHKRYIKSD